MENKKSWGGRRAGSGRKKILPQDATGDKRRNYTFYMSAGEQKLIKMILLSLRGQKDYTDHERRKTYAEMMDIYRSVYLDYTLNNQDEKQISNQDKLDNITTNQDEKKTSNQDEHEKIIYNQNSDFVPQPFKLK